jgi:nucleotide-binding universal stress UspA family protein
MYKKILVPLDGSPLAESALPYAAAIAGSFNSDVLLVRVFQSIAIPFDLYTLGPDVADDYDQGLQLQLETEAGQYLIHVQKRLRLQNIRSRIFVLGGIVTDVILDLAEVEAVDLIVMSTHGRSGFSRWVYGSVASKVLQAAPCPVLLVRAQNVRLENDEGA